jgi:hypothetical protein
MQTPLIRRRRSRLIYVAVALVAVVIVIGGASVVTGYGLNLRAFGRATISLVRALLNYQTESQALGYRNVVFLHHSVGANLINEGGVRELFAQVGYQFWDHDYNWRGLRAPNGQYTGYSYNVPDDNTDPDGLMRLFEQPVYGLPLNTFSALLQHEVIVVKSCFPASAIQSDRQLQERQAMYLKMRAVMDQHPDKLFIVLTQPPLAPIETTPEAAGRARALADWLKSDEYLKGHSNISTYDLFGQLIDANPQSPDYNMLRADYRNGVDSHPNLQANRTVGPHLVKSVIEAIEGFRS